MSFTVYALPQCYYSLNAIRYLQDQKQPVQVKWIEPSQKAQMKAKFKWNTFPQIYYTYHNKHYHIGGFDRIQQWLPRLKHLSK